MKLGHFLFWQLLFFVIPGITCATPDQNKTATTINQLLTDSQQFSQHKQYDQAIILLRQAQKLDPDNLEVQLAIARNLAWEGDYVAAGQLLTQLSEQYPDNADINLQQGYLYYYIGDLQEAQALFKTILLQSPNYTDAKQGLAQVKKALAISNKPTTPLAAIITQTSTITSASTAQAAQLIAKSQRFSQAKQFSAAITTLHQAEKLAPDNLDIALAIARNLSWQKNYAAAQQLLTQLFRAHPDNTDVQLVQAYLDYYQKKYAAAKTAFQHVLSINPKDSDAKQGLALTMQAEQNALLAEQTTHKNTLATTSASTKKFTWLIDSGTEYSQFFRQPQPSWNQEFLQITRLFDNGMTAIHARIDRYFEYQELDMRYEIGVDHRFNPRVSGYLYGYATPNANFMPFWGLAGGGGVRLDNPDQHRMPKWLTLDLKNDDYPVNGIIQTVNPGFRLEPGDNWAVIIKQITIIQQTAQYGWLLQLNGQLKPGLRFNTGFANAPDTENGITVLTRTIFGGLAIDIIPALTLHLEYTHDNRENSWIRGAYFASFTYRI